MILIIINNVGDQEGPIHECAIMCSHVFSWILICFRMFSRFWYSQGVHRLVSYTKWFQIRNKRPASFVLSHEII